jgi:hypothetical protein
MTVESGADPASVTEYMKPTRHPPEPLPEPERPPVSKPPKPPPEASPDPSPPHPIPPTTPGTKREAHLVQRDVSEVALHMFPRKKVPEWRLRKWRAADRERPSRDRCGTLRRPRIRILYEHLSLWWPARIHMGTSGSRRYRPRANPRRAHPRSVSLATTPFILDLDAWSAFVFAHETRARERVCFQCLF